MGVSAVALIISCKPEITGQTDTGNSQTGGNNNLPPESTCGADTAHFQQQVLPIFISNRSIPAYQTSANAPCGLDYGSYQTITAKQNDERSLFVVNKIEGFSAMPKNGNKLSSCELSEIKNGWMKVRRVTNHFWGVKQQIQ